MHFVNHFTLYPKEVLNLRHLRSLIHTLALCASLLPTSLSAKESQSRELRMVQAFAGVCGQNAGRYEAVLNLLKALGGMETPPEMAALLAPRDPTAEYASYYFEDAEGPYMIGISRGLQNGSHVATCALAVDYVDIELLVSTAKDVLGFENSVLDETNMGQRMRAWNLPNTGNRTGLMVSDGGPSKINALSISLIAPAVE